MKFQVLSDLHLEFLKKAPEMPVLGEYLVLAGDVGYAGSPIWREFLRECRAKYKHIYYVAGNHEFYNGEYGERLRIMREEAGAGLTFLEKEAVDIEGTSLRVVGTTLWTDVPPEESYAVSQIMSDYRKIRYSGRGLKVVDTNFMHLESRKFLEKEIDRCAEEGREAIVITHHLPSFKMVDEKYKGENNYGFASECDDLIGPPVKFWVCGHSHTQMVKEINRIPVIIGAVGYPSELRAAGKPPGLCVVDVDNADGKAYVKFT